MSSDYSLNALQSAKAFYSSPSTLAEAVAQVEFPEERRAALVAALCELNGHTPELALLAKPGTAAVVTGQQVGLFSGPALHSSLASANLKEELKT
jgi:uncharacterized protein YllA (UPF0747 family)